MPERPRLLPIVAALTVAVGLASCGSSADEGGGSGGGLRVEASFYPLQWVAERVGGDLVSVGNLTPPGAEPHELELSPKEVAAVQEADVVVYLSELQPAVDGAVAEAGGEVFDAAEAADLDLTYTPIEEGEEHDDEAGTDPHFWLDPDRLEQVARAMARAFAEADPTHADRFRRNAEDLGEALSDLDAEIRADLASCTNRDLVTSHNAFGYFARRYDLRQVGITGLTPEGEPAAGQLAEVTRFVEREDVRTIYFETLVSPDVAETVAEEAGVDTAVLDPIEGLTDRSEGRDYLQVMRANVKNLRSGQPCP